MTAVLPDEAKESEVKTIAVDKKGSKKEKKQKDKRPKKGSKKSGKMST
jgi:hypothetical protein